MENKIVLFYDGECAFCNSTVQWILKRNKAKSIYFATIQGEYAKKILDEQFKIDKKIDSLVVHTDNKLFLYSDGAIRLTQELDGFWKWFVIFKIAPKSLRNWAYKGFAKRRFKWFGKAESCQIPTPEIRKRFID